MKKLTIASLVGGVIFLCWQTLSWSVLSLHSASEGYTSKQDSIMAYLNTQFSGDGSYMMPGYPQGTSREEMEKTMSSREGKPWAQIQYHKELKVNMGMNILRGLLVNIVIVALLCWVLMKLGDPGFTKIFLTCLITGIIVFLNSPYAINIWFPMADINAHFTDALVSWGLCGIWLGWYLKAKK